MKHQVLIISNILKKCSYLLLLSFLFFSFAAQAQTTLNYTSSSTWLCPAGVTSVSVVAYGGGGGGGGTAAAKTGRAGGGGGGASAQNATLTVVPGTTYTITVGLAGIAGVAAANGGAGGDTSFGTTLVVAKGGSGGTFGAETGTPYPGGAAGSGANSIGTTTFSGGPGGNGVVATAVSGSGAGSAGTAANGNGTNDGIAPTVVAGGVAGVAGVSGSNNGTNGFAGGGGGSGARGSGTDGATRNGGAGGAGLLVLTFTSSEASAYFYDGSGPLTTVTNWGINADGTGTNPTDITAAGKTWTIRNTTAVTTDAIWTLGASSKVVVGAADQAAVTLTITNGFAISGGSGVDIPAALSGSNSVIVQEFVSQPIFGTLHSTSEVHYQNNTIATVIVTNSFIYGKLFFDGTAPLSTINWTPVANVPPKAGTFTVAEAATVFLTSGTTAWTNVTTVVINGKLRVQKTTGLASVASGANGSSLGGSLQFPTTISITFGSSSIVEYNRSTNSTDTGISGLTYANLTVSGDGNSKLFLGATTVTGTFILNMTLNGTYPTETDILTGAGFLTLGNGATLVRTAGTLDIAPTFGTTVNLSYNGLTAITPGVEMPSLSTVLYNLTVKDAQLTLNADTTVNNDLTLLSGATTALNVTTAKNLTVTGAIINDASGCCAVTIENNANLIQAGTTNTNSGNIVVKRNGNPLKRLDYTLWSSPVTGTQTLADFSPMTSQAPSRFYSYDTLYNTGGVNGAYGAIASPTMTTFTTGSGYLIRMPNTDLLSGYDAGTATLNYSGAFSGVPNNGDISVVLIGTGGTGLRYNLVGNPYPSTVNMTTFISDNTTAIESTLYFWRKTNGSGTAYCTWVSGGPTGTFATNGNANSLDPLGVLQTGQGFFVEAKSGASSLTFKNGQRVANNTGQFFKTKQVVAAGRVWLNATNAAGDFSQMAVTYSDQGSLGVDMYDGKFINDSKFALTSNINNAEYTIQGRPAFDLADVVALNFKTDLAGDYTIAIDHTDGLFATGQDVYLVDSKTGAETNLKEGEYTFTAIPGVDNTRFSLKYQKTLKVNASAFNDNSVVVYRNNGTISVISGANAISNIKVYDIQGRLVSEQKEVNATSASIKNLRAFQQVLLVKVTGADNSVVTKKVVN